MNASKLYYILKNYIIDYDGCEPKYNYIDVKNGYNRTFKTIANERPISSSTIKELASTKTKKEIDEFFKKFDRNY